MEDSSPSPRRPLHERSKSRNNSRAIRLVPSTPPQLLGQSTVHPNERDEIYSRTPLPTHPSHILGPGKKSKTRGFFDTTPVFDEAFQKPSTPQPPPSSSGSSTATTRIVPHPPHNAHSATKTPTTKPKAPTRKRLSINKDGRTFALLRDDPQPADDGASISPILSPVSRTSFDSFPSYASRTARNSSISASYAADEDSTLTTIPGTPPPSEVQNKLAADPPGTSPGNYQLVGGIRKVPKTPDSKQKSTVSSESPLPSLPGALDDLPTSSHDLSSKTSFQSTDTNSTLSETSNYKVYRYTSPSPPEDTVEVPSSSDSNCHIIQESLSESSVIYRPRAQTYETEDYEVPSSEFSRSSSVVQRPQTSNSDANYEIHGDLSPSTSYLDNPYSSKYSHESLVVPALKPRGRRSNEKLGYYKSRSRESLRSKSRTGSFTSISTVLSHREAFRAVVSSGLLVHLPTPAKSKGPSSWAEPSEGNYPQRSYMNENPHQWSSQLSTVLSVSDGGSERNSRSWSDATGRRSGGYASTLSRTSRPGVALGSPSFGQEDSRTRSNGIEPPQPIFARSGRRHDSTSSARMIESQDEYGDGITDLHDLRSRPSRTRLSGFYSIGSENGRTNTMRSTSSSRANSLLANSIPTWAKLYYGSGERRYLGAPGSSTEGSDSRASSFRSGSPNTDNFPLNIYSPRRRPRDSRQPLGHRDTRGSMEITAAPLREDDGRVIERHPESRLRTWSMSSVWSPHLRLDRRAMRKSVWEPPSVNWSTEGSWFGRRNVQIIMFIAGFLFPFSWIIAALLPLPPRPVREMEERDNSTSNLGVSNDTFNDYERQFGPMDDARYESAKWWRRLNRWMSLVGFLIIAAIIILVVVSLREGW